MKAMTIWCFNDVPPRPCQSSYNATHQSRSVPEEGIMSYSDVINPYSSGSSIWQVMLRIQRKRIVALVLPRRRSTDVEEVAS
jgi:hypothetical protein